MRLCLVSEMFTAGRPIHSLASLNTLLDTCADSCVGMPHSHRYQTKLLDMQRQVNPQVLQQLANEQMLNAYLTKQ